MTKSVRLTNQMRDDIIGSVMDKWKEANPMPDLKAAEHEFAMYIWDDYYKKEKAALANVPTRFLKKTSGVKYSVNGCVYAAHFGDGVAMPCDFSEYSSPILKIIEDTNSKYQKMIKIQDAAKAWSDESNGIYRETRAVLDSVTTTKQLLEVWPEVEDFIPAYIADPNKAVKLPAIQMSRLNERIGLNKKKK